MEAPLAITNLEGMTTFETKDGVRLFFNDWGQGKPVVFITSAWLNTEMWEFQMPYLVEQGFRCVGYDRRGHGRSDWPWDGYDYDTLSDDLAALIEHRDLRDVTLVAHSVGGGEAIRYLSRHGSRRISRLVLLAATAPFPMKTADNPDGIEKHLADMVSAARTADRPKWMADNTDSFLGLAPPGKAVSQEMRRWFQDMCVRCSARAARAAFEMGFTTDLRAEMRDIRVPTLVMHGRADAQAPYEICGRKSAELIPESRLVTYDDAAHGLFITHAEQINRDLVAFIRG